jgi:hypothetical protein
MDSVLQFLWCPQQIFPLLLTCVDSKRLGRSAHGQLARSWELPFILFSGFDLTIIEVTS